VKSAKQLERHFKGVSNYNRINILVLVRNSKKITLEEISEKLGGDIKNISQHTQRLVSAGLLDKKHNGRLVEHTLSPYGEEIVQFMKKFGKV